VLYNEGKECAFYSFISLSELLSVKKFFLDLAAGVERIN